MPHADAPAVRPGIWPLAVAPLVASVLALAWALGSGIGGIIYVLIFALATLPGLPLGFALFGRSHAAGWMAGAVIGYGLTAVALWAPVQMGLPGSWTPVAAWLVLTFAIYVSPRPTLPLVPLPAWRGADTAALAFTLLLVPAITSAPFLRIGQRDSTGSERYRAYFTADFLWHVALTAELSKQASPPRNPYLARRPLHYYWSYFNLPATVVRLGGVVPSIRQHLTINALVAGLLFIGTIFMATWAAVPRAGPVMTAVCIALLAASGEGLYAAWDIYSRGRPLSGLLDLNIDAITSWWLRSATIDSLPRSLWYTPQHAAACALSLIALVVACRGGALRPAASVIAGVALGLALIFSPFLGGSFALVYGAAAAWSSMRSGPRMLAGLLRYIVAAVPVLAALGWCVAAGTFEGAGGAVAVGASPLAMAAPGQLLLLALGPVVTLAVGGLAVAARSEYPWHVSLAGLAVGLFMLYFVTLSKEPIWVGWRAGQIILVTIPALIAAFFAKAWDLGYRVTVGIAAAAALTAGLPTTLIDTWNAQDVTNMRMAASFRWTVVVPPDTLAVTAWIREHTPPDALVQMSIEPRGRETWTLIPTFAERRMAAGKPISLLAMPEYDERSKEADAVFSTTDAAEAARLARRLRLDYLYLDAVERRAYGPDAAAKFDDPRYFIRAFGAGDAAVYQVR